MHGNRDVVADRAVGSVLVVVSTPILQLFSGIRKAHEPMCVEAFRTELAVEGLDEAIVCGLSWPREVQRNVVGIGPEIEIAKDKFAAVVNFDRLRVTNFPTDPFERLNDIFTPIAE